MGVLSSFVVGKYIYIVNENTIFSHRSTGLRVRKGRLEQDKTTPLC
jgi:hypothetical protein